ncbi:MAG: DUF2378 family protein [Myxococcota bacterium]
MTRVRGTLLGSSITALRERGLYEAYLAALGESEREELVTLVPMSWIDIELALTHYRLVDRLVPDPEVQRAIGRSVGTRVQESYLKTLVRSLRVAGVVGPRRLLQRMPSIWSRVFEGGAVGVDQTGPKDVLLRVEGVPLFAVPYFGNACEGVFQVGLELITRKAFVRQVAVSEDALSMGASWV